MFQRGRMEAQPGRQDPEPWGGRCGHMEGVRVAVKLQEARSPKSGVPVAPLKEFTQGTEGSRWERGTPRAWARGREGRQCRLAVKGPGFWSGERAEEEVATCHKELWLRREKRF